MKTSELPIGVPTEDDDIPYVGTVSGKRKTMRGKPAKLPLSDSAKASFAALSQEHNLLIARLATAEGKVATLNYDIAVAVAAALEAAGIGDGSVTPPEQTVPPFSMSQQSATFEEGSVSNSTSLTELSLPPTGVARQITPQDNYITFNGTKTRLIPGVTTLPKGQYFYTIRDYLIADPTKYVEKVFGIVVYGANTEVPLPGSDELQDEKILTTNFMLNGGQPANTVGLYGTMFNDLDVSTVDKVFVKDITTGAIHDTQIEAKTFYDSGFVRFATMAVQTPAGALDVMANKQLVRNPAGAPAAGAALALTSATFPVEVTITPKAGGAAQVFNMENFLTTGWRQGHLVTEKRALKVLDTSFLGSQKMQLIANLAVTKDGMRRVELSLRNGEAAKDAAVTVNYSIQVKVDGVTVLPTTVVDNHSKGRKFDRTFHVKNGATLTYKRPLLFPDNDYYARTGMGVWVDKALTVGDKIRSKLSNDMTNPDWNVVWSARGMQPYMPNTGGRDDIGALPSWDMATLVARERWMYEGSEGRAEAASSIPWHIWDSNASSGSGTNNGAWLNPQDSTLWTDSRDGNWSEPRDHYWTIDNAHPPQTVALMANLNGSQNLIDSVAAQACYGVMIQWPDGGRGKGLFNGSSAQGANIFFNAITRGSAWGIRDLMLAMMLMPAEFAPKNNMFRKIIDTNFDWVISRIPTWKSRRENYGWMDDSVYGDGTQFAPWMNDYLQSTLSRAYEAGFSKAVNTIFDFTANWQIGRFLQPESRFYPTDGVNYNVQRRHGNTAENPNQPEFKTWAEVQAAMVLNNRSNGPVATTTWKSSEGYYGPLGVMTCMLFLRRNPDDADARNALAFVLNNPPPFTELPVVGNSGEGIWTGVVAPGMTRGNSPIVFVPNQTFTRPRNPGARFVIQTTGSIPTSWVINGDAKGCSISNGGVFTLGNLAEGDYTFSVSASSKYGGSAATGTIALKVTAGTGEPVADKPIWVPGQEFTLSESLPANTKVATLQFGGGTPTSGTVNLSGVASTLFDIRNGYELFTKIALSGQSFDAKPFDVTLANSGGSTYGTISIAVSATATFSTDNFYGTGSTRTLGRYSVTRAAINNYTGDLFTARNKDTGELKTFTVADAPTWAKVRAFGYNVAITKLFDQTGLGRHFVQDNTDLQPDLVRRSDSKIGALCIDFGSKKHMYCNDFIINSTELHMFAAVWQEFLSSGGTRVLSYIDRDEVNDWDNDRSTNLLASNGVLSERGMSADRTTRGSSSIPLMKKYVGGVKYSSGSVAQVTQNAEQSNGTLQSAVQFRTGTMRLGAQKSDGDGWGFFCLSEFTIGTNTTSADMLAINNAFATAYPPDTN